MKRNKVLYEPGHRFAVVIEESVLRYPVGGAGVLAGQLGHLLEVMSLPSVWLGIIPFTAEARPMWTLETFTCFDAERAHVELLAAQVTVTVSREVRTYLDAFAELAALAVQGRWLDSCFARRHSDGHQVEGEDWVDLRDQIIKTRWEDTYVQESAVDPHLAI